MALPTEDNIYGYDASKVAAIVAAVLNGILFVAHGYLSLWAPRTLRYKHRYTIPLFVAAFFAMAGYATRIASVSDPSSVGLYAQSSSWIVLSPIFVCAMLYWQMKYLVLLLLPPGPQQRLFGVNPVWLGRIFITSDVLSFLTQGAGSGIAASGNWEGNMKDIGEGVLIGGLCLQLLTFTVYIIFMLRLVNRVNRSPQATFIPGVKPVLIGVTIAAVHVQVSLLMPTLPLHSQILTTIRTRFVPFSA